VKIKNLLHADDMILVIKTQYKMYKLMYVWTDEIILKHEI